MAIKNIDSSAEILCGLGIVQKALDTVSKLNHDSTLMRDWLRLLSCLTAFSMYMINNSILYQLIFK